MSGRFKSEKAPGRARTTRRQIVRECFLFIFSGRAVPFLSAWIDSIRVFDIWLQSGRSSVSGEGASKPQRDFPRVTAPRREASKFCDHSSATGVVCASSSRPQSVCFRFVFATSSWPSKGGPLTAPTGVFASLRARTSASATGEANEEVVRVSSTTKQESGGGDPTVLST